MLLCLLSYATQVQGMCILKYILYITIWCYVGGNEKIIFEVWKTISVFVTHEMMYMYFDAYRIAQRRNVLDSMNIYWVLCWEIGTLNVFIVRSRAKEIKSHHFRSSSSSAKTSNNGRLANERNNFFIFAYLIYFLTIP